MTEAATAMAAGLGATADWHRNALRYLRDDYRVSRPFLPGELEAPLLAARPPEPVPAAKPKPPETKSQAKPPGAEKKPPPAEEKPAEPKEETPPKKDEPTIAVNPSLDKWSEK